MCIGRRGVATVLALAQALVLCAGTARAQQVRLVAGDTSPLGWPYSAFTDAVVDAAGRVVFAGNSSGIFGRNGDAIGQRVGAGDVLGDGRRIAGVSPPTLTADGCVVTRATFAQGGEALLRACGTTRLVLLDTTAEAPGGGAIRAFDTRVFAASTDVVAATATLNDGTNVLLRLDGGGVTEIARSGGAAPAGGTYAAFRLLGVTTAGVVGFRATVGDGPDGLFAGNGASTRTVAGVGQASPVGGDFTSIGGGSLHPSGRLAFRAVVSSGKSGVFAADAVGIVTPVRPVALEGDPLPIGGATIKSFPSSIDPWIDGSGRVAFRALIAGATDPPRPSGVFVKAPDGTVTLIAAVRDALPGIGTVSRLRDPLLADDGSVLVSAVLSGIGGSLLVARDGTITPLATTGDATDADAGDSRFRFGASAVVATADGAVFLGERDAIFRAETDGSTTPLAYTGKPSRLGGVMANLGPPVVDTAGSVFFGVELQRALFNEVLLAAQGGDVDTFISPDRRLLGGGGIAEFFPTDVDTLARPCAATTGVVFTAALQGAKASQAVFLARAHSHPKVLVRAGQKASGNRITALGTAAVAGRQNALAVLAEVAHGDDRLRAVVTRTGRKVGAVAIESGSTRSRAGGKFGELGPPAVSDVGAVFRGTLDGTTQEGVFVARGKKTGVVAVSGDLTTTGARLRSFGDPVAVGKTVWFLARVAGSVAPSGVYRVTVDGIPGKTDPALSIEPVLVPGDPAPGGLGGVVVRIDSLRVGPGGVVAVIVGVGGGATSGAILQYGG